MFRNSLRTITAILNSRLLSFFFLALLLSLFPQGMAQAPADAAVSPTKSIKGRSVGCEPLIIKVGEISVCSLQVLFDDGDIRDVTRAATWIPGIVIRGENPGTISVSVSFLGIQDKTEVKVIGEKKTPSGYDPSQDPGLLNRPQTVDSEKIKGFLDEFAKGKGQGTRPEKPQQPQSPVPIPADYLKPSEQASKPEDQSGASAKSGGEAAGPSGGTEGPTGSNQEGPAQTESAQSGKTQAVDTQPVGGYFKGTVTFSEEKSTSGLEFSVASGGGLTGKLNWQGKSIPLSGSKDNQGNISLTGSMGSGPMAISAILQGKQTGDNAGGTAMLKLPLSLEALGQEIFNRLGNNLTRKTMGDKINLLSALPKLTPVTLNGTWQTTGSK